MASKQWSFSSLRILSMIRFMYSSTLPARAISDLNGIVSLPTHDTMAFAFGRFPAPGFSVSRVSFSIAWKHLFMWVITFTGLLPLDRMSSRSAVETK